MLPTRLEMRNFLAFRAPQPISFDGLDLACLSGDNGVGKSSILDAITWALWGRARAKRDQELIHLGQDDMQVQLDFLQDGARYRVSRRRARAGRGSRGVLDLLAWGEHSSPRIINRGGIRSTQEQIKDLLRLDYETFVHSAFLQQGSADAFTTKTASERKAVLSDILGLERWTQYENETKQRLAALSSQADILRQDIDRINDETRREPQLRTELDGLTAALADAQTQLDQAGQVYAQVSNAAEQLRQARANKSETERRIGSLRADIEAAQAEIERQDDKIAEFQRAIEQGESIEVGYQQLVAARENQDQVIQHLARRQELDRRIHELERKLADQRAELTREAQVLGERITGLQTVLDEAAETDVAALRSELQALEALDARRGAAHKNRQKLTGQRAKFAARMDSLEAQGRALNQRLDQLGQLEGPACPLCGQALTEAHRDQTLTQLRAERDSLRERYRDCARRTREIDEQRRSLDEQLAAWALQLKALPALQQQVGAAGEQNRKAQKAADALKLESATLSQIEARLTNNDYGHEVRAQLEALKQQTQADTAAYADIKSQLEAFADFDSRHSQLEFAQANLPDAQRSRGNTAQRLMKARQALAADENKLGALADLIATLSAKLAHENESRQALEDRRSQAQRLRERIAISKQELNAIASGRESKTRLSKRLADLEAQMSLVSDLRAAFGKQGLPAMIIETVIPELETQANDLLARMTDGRMNLRFSTQLEQLDGNLAETLDIAVADELGARPYELFSGGEAFRINFAIRIALSKLLARRAGAQLRTLFIDEGFGSQDEAGRSRMLDAIKTIRGDFDLILVITHIDEIRDAFPRRLLVTKTATGSQVSMR